MGLSIAWTVDGDITGNAATGYQSKAASNRYRTIIPSNALVARGHSVSLIRLPAVDSICFIERPDVLVLGKVYPNSGHHGVASSQSIAYLESARLAGVRVVADVNDNHFANPEVGRYWRDLVKQVDACIVGSAAMAEVVRQQTTKPLHVIGDPVGSPAGTAAVVPWRRKLFGKPPRLEIVWFGALNNVTAMERWAADLVPLWKKQPYRIRLITSEHPAVRRLVDLYCERQPGAMEFVAWSEAAQWQAVEEAHVVMLPSDPLDPKKAVKTSNRLTDAINAGRYVIASPIAAYEPFSDYCTITDDPLGALNEYLKEPDRALERLHRGQDVVRRVCDPVAISDLWLQAFSSSQTS